MRQSKSIGLSLVLSLAMGSLAYAGVVKTKTKSNQSNDRIAQSELLAGLGDGFSRLDANKDGKLDGGEQSHLLFVVVSDGTNAVAPPKKGIEIKIMRGSAAVIFSSHLDANGDGKISRAEWLADGQAQFDLADADHDGTVSDAEATRFGWNVKSSETR